MIKYLILLLVALIVFPIVILFIKKIDLKTKLLFLVGGFLIALLGLLVQSTLSLYYSLLIMVGLIFVGAVVITKQVEKQKLVEQEDPVYMPQTTQVTVEEPVQPYAAPIPVAKPAPEPVAIIQTEDWLSPSKKEDQ